mmetsp:Transcript_4360/g.16377  ORF Transcript_4360/g.16377 Transcript_4360/m.16377 type:complete len:240 (-) Transcript_4360:353-1072(-)
MTSSTRFGSTTRTGCRFTQPRCTTSSTTGSGTGSRRSTRWSSRKTPCAGGSSRTRGARRCGRGGSPSSSPSRRDDFITTMRVIRSPVYSHHRLVRRCANYDNRSPSIVHICHVLANSYATSTMPHVGPARIALGAHPANSALAPPSLATAPSSARTPLGTPLDVPRSGTAPAPPGPSTGIPPAKSFGASRICTRVLTTSSGVVSAAVNAPAHTPDVKLTRSMSPRERGASRGPGSTRLE